MRRGFLIDMDGVIYRGGKLIPGADDLINRLIREEHPFLFLTNNSQRTTRDVATSYPDWGLRYLTHTFSLARWPPRNSYRLKIREEPRS